MKNRFVKLTVSFLFVVFSVFEIAAQNPQCALPGAPKLLGLSLGMSPAAAKGVFGRDLKIKVKTSGDRTFFQNYVEKTPPASLAGVRALYLRFLDGRLYQIEIFYENRTDIPTLETFAANLSARMNFSADAWRFEKGRATIDCGAFTLVADKPLNPRVELTDAARLAEALARRKKSE